MPSYTGINQDWLMVYSIVIAAHNEEAFIVDCLESVMSQTLSAHQVIVVNDNSTDRTAELLKEFQNSHPQVQAIDHRSSDAHMPGSKVVAAFNYGLKQLDLEAVDLIVKLDADLILPNNYFEVIVQNFKQDPLLGIAGGFAYEQNKKGEWKRNHPMNKEHIRGAFKTYRKECFIAMNGLREAMGWDTADELLAQYQGYRIKTIEQLEVKHLRPLGSAYNKRAKLLQGKAMYGLRYGFTLTLIASLKTAFKQKRIRLFFDQIAGFRKAKREKAPFLVSQDEGAFIRKLRWKGIRNKLMSA